METSRILYDVSGSLAHHQTLPRGSTNLAERLDFANSGRAVVPDALAPFHLASPAERRRRVRDVLLLAWRVYRRGGLSLCDSINEAADGSATGEYAKTELRRVLLEINLVAWESHPNRTRDDVHRLLRRAIGRLTPHRGGWRVSR